MSIDKVFYNGKCVCFEKVEYLLFVMEKSLRSISSNC